MLNANINTHPIRKRDIALPTEIDFFSNDYLGLSSHPALIAESKKYLTQLGSTGSPMVCGYQKSHLMAEKAFAEFVNREDAILCQSGFIANMSVMQLLAQHHDLIFLDRDIHASFIDGAKLTGLNIKRYQNIDHLWTLLQSSSYQKAGIITESVFSMSGRKADIARLVEVKKAIKGTLIVDDAHGIGVLGHRGKSVSTSFSQDAVDLLICPLGKAFGLSGAMVCASQAFIHQFIQTARGYRYSTHISPLIAHIIPKSIELVSQAQQERRHIASHLKVLGRNSHIFCVEAATEPEHFDLKKIEPPTVRKTSYRICVKASHTLHDIVQLKQFLDYNALYARSSTNRKHIEAI